MQTVRGNNLLEDYNLLDVYLLLIEIKTQFPKKDIWLYTGFHLDYMNFLPAQNDSVFNLQHNLIHSVLSLCDVVVDGPFIQEQRDITLQFRGSTNQRIIDVAKTIEQKEIVLWEKH